jgi:hypothetical protein
VIKIPTDKIREVIGTGGKVIREIVEKTGAKIDIEDDGTVKVASANGESIKAAIKWIKLDRGRAGSRPDLQRQGREGDGLRRLRELLRRQGRPRPHLAALAEAASQKTSDVVKEGDKVKVKLLGFDDRGKVRLSMKIVDQATGEDCGAGMPYRLSDIAQKFNVHYYPIVSSGRAFARCGSGPIQQGSGACWRRWSTRTPGWRAGITACPTPKTR